MSKAVDVRGLRVVYQGRGHSVEALADLTFSVEASELVCVVGPSGCGKTTMLRCIAGLLEPTAGEVLLEGARVAGPPPGMAVVFQEYGRSLFPWMRVRANVELPLRAKRLAGDMQQRVAIARAVAYEPHVYAQIQQAKRDQGRATSPSPEGAAAAPGS